MPDRSILLNGEISLSESVRVAADDDAVVYSPELARAESSVDVGANAVMVRDNLAQAAGMPDFYDDWEDGSLERWNQYVWDEGSSWNILEEPTPEGHERVLELRQEESSSNLRIGWIPDHFSTGWQDPWVHSVTWKIDSLDRSVAYQTHTVLHWWDGPNDPNDTNNLEYPERDDGVDLYTRIGFTDSDGNHEPFYIYGKLIEEDSVEFGHVSWEEGVWYIVNTRHLGDGEYTAEVYEHGNPDPITTVTASGDPPGSEPRPGGLHMSGSQPAPPEYSVWHDIHRWERTG